MLKCPNCKLANPVGAEFCDCGFNFNSGVLKKLPAGPRGNDVVCTECYVVSSRRELPRSLAGIGQFDCPKCGKTIRYPLKPVTRVFYWVILLIVPTLLFAGHWLRFVALPGIGWFAVAVLLGWDQTLRSKVKNAWLQHERQGSPRY